MNNNYKDMVKFFFFLVTTRGYITYCLRLNKIYSSAFHCRNSTLLPVVAASVYVFPSSSGVVCWWWGICSPCCILIDVFYLSALAFGLSSFIMVYLVCHIYHECLFLCCLSFFSQILICSLFWGESASSLSSSSMTLPSLFSGFLMLSYSVIIQ